MTTRVDLNVDIGEGFAFDEALLEFASSANVCCGEHAGSWEITAQTVALCKSKGIRIGAHPGYPDRASMGRREPTSGEKGAFSASIIEQADRFCQAFPCAYLKPHGAWYNAIAAEDAYALGVFEAVWERTRLPVMILGSFALQEGIQCIREGFADRAYLADGRLMPRSEPGAVLVDPRQIQHQVLRIAPEVDSICLHGDTPNALELAELVFRTLVDAGYEVGV